MNDLLRNPDTTFELRYRLYRHKEPITAANLAQADLLDEIRPLSIYYDRQNAAKCLARTHAADHGSSIPRGSDCRALEVYLHDKRYSYAQPNHKMLRESVLLAPHDFPQDTGWFGYHIGLHYPDEFDWIVADMGSWNFADYGKNKLRESYEALWGKEA